MSNEMKMGSKEIATITGKRHDNVKRTIDYLVRESVVASPHREEKGTAGRSVVEYMVGERDSYVIVAQLSPQFTAKLVDRWRALESGEPSSISGRFVASPHRVEKAPGRRDFRSD